MSNCPVVLCPYFLRDKLRRLLLASYVPKINLCMPVVVAECKRRLTAAGFSELNMKESWKVQPSGKVILHIQTSLETFCAHAKFSFSISSSTTSPLSLPLPWVDDTNQAMDSLLLELTQTALVSGFVICCYSSPFVLIECDMPTVYSLCSKYFYGPDAGKAAQPLQPVRLCWGGCGDIWRGNLAHLV